MGNYIRFDWAIKRLLRDKANFAVLEGFLTTLLGMRLTISRLLESEGNQESEYSKFNRVDLLAENTEGELFLIEVQNNNEYAYFQRMLFGASKLVTEYINRGDNYDKVRKVYSVNVVYFPLGGHGRDVQHYSGCAVFFDSVQLVGLQFFSFLNKLTFDIMKNANTNNIIVMGKRYFRKFAELFVNDFSFVK